ncbi:MAG: hypothetical protein JWM36_677 [Hyphomicrobiales bacterium]|nr:hypothetical protein [Hyphomicrobiales bacterium]
MTRIAREQEKLARVPTVSAIGCPVEKLGREFGTLLRLEEAYDGKDRDGDLIDRSITRTIAIERAAPAFKAESPLGALFQLMLITLIMRETSASCLEKSSEAELARAEADMRSCLHSVAEFLEAHFGVDRNAVAGDMYLRKQDSPFRIHETPLPKPEAGTRIA